MRYPAEYKIVIIEGLPYMAGAERSVHIHGTMAGSWTLRTRAKGGDKSATTRKTRGGPMSQTGRANARFLCGRGCS